MPSVCAACVVFLCFASCLLASEQGGEVWCGMAQWAAYRPSKGRFIPGNKVPPSLCNVLNYARLGLHPENLTLVSRDLWGDLRVNGTGMISGVVDLKKQNPELKVIISVGGWDEGSIKFSKMAADPRKRRAFVDSVWNFLRSHRLDGVEISWQFPGDRGGVPADKFNFPILLKELRKRLEGYLLVAELNCKKYSVEAGYRLREIASAVDYVTLVSYQFHGPWERITKPSAPLVSSDGNNIEEVVEYMLEEGLPPEKILLGVATHGVAFQLQPGADQEMGSPAKGPYKASWTEETGLIAYLEVCWNLLKKGWKERWDLDSLTPYAFKEDKFVSYDNLRSIQFKVDLLKRLGLAGAYIWSLDTDDFDGNCGQGRYPLTSAVVSALASYHPTVINHIF